MGHVSEEEREEEEENKKRRRERKLHAFSYWSCNVCIFSTLEEKMVAVHILPKGPSKSSWNRRVAGVRKDDSSAWLFFSYLVYSPLES